MTERVVGGLDGCRAGWVLVTVPARGGHATAGRAGAARRCSTSASWPTSTPSARDLESGRLVAAAIDIPIGLPARVPRPCDREARRLLGPRRSSVFPAPVRSRARGRDLRPELRRVPPRLRPGTLEAAVQHPAQDPRGRCAAVARPPGTALRDAPRAQLHGPRRRPDAVQQAHGRRPGRTGVRPAHRLRRPRRPSSARRRPGRNRTTCSTRWSAPGRPAASWRAATSGSVASSTDGACGWRSSPEPGSGAAVAAGAGVAMVGLPSGLGLTAARLHHSFQPPARCKRLSRPANLTRTRKSMPGRARRRATRRGGSRGTPRPAAGGGRHGEGAGRAGGAGRSPTRAR